MPSWNSLDPTSHRRFDTIESNPEVVAELILRNRKTEVTDADGNFIFRGHKVYRLAVKPSEESRIFQLLLRDYLLRGYKAGDAAAGAGRSRNRLRHDYVSQTGIQ